jgi:hypothetical protein
MGNRSHFRTKRITDNRWRTKEDYIHQLLEESYKKPQEAPCCKYLILLRLMKNKSRYILKDIEKSPCYVGRVSPTARCLQVAAEWKGLQIRWIRSCEHTEQAVASSRQRVVFLLCCWADELRAAHRNTRDATECNTKPGTWMARSCEHGLIRARQLWASQWLCSTWLVESINKSFKEDLQPGHLEYVAVLPTWLPRSVRCIWTRKIPTIK